MNQSIQIYENGGPEVLRWEESTVGRPGPGEVLLRHTAVGLNLSIFIREVVFTHWNFLKSWAWKEPG